MKKIEKLKFSNLEREFPVISEDKLREILGGFYCFAACLNYLGQSGTYFEYYYGGLYGNSQGVSPEYVGGVLTLCGIGYSNPTNNDITKISATGREIVTINDGTHAVIYKGSQKNLNGKIEMTYYDPQNGSTGVYTFTAANPVAMIHIK